MTSGAGGWDLIQVSPQKAVAVPVGDMTYDAGTHTFRFDATPEGVAMLIEAWLNHASDYSNGLAGCAAFALEPLDPAGNLPADKRAEWDRLIDGLRGPYGETSYATFHLTQRAVDAVRRRLAQSNPTYRRIRDALANPISGDWLRLALLEGDLTALS